MNKTSFFTPVRYDRQEKSIQDHIINSIEDYFSLGGKKACVISNNMVDGSQEAEIKYRPENKAKKLILTAIKVASYTTGIIPLLFLVAKAIFRLTHKFHTIPSVVLLKKGVPVKDTTVQNVQAVMDKVLEKKDCDGLKFYSAQYYHRVFSIKTEPNIIFKMETNNDGIIDRYRKMVFAKTVCRTHDLGLLVIPGAKIIKVNHKEKDYILIAEEKIEINPEESAQEQYYQDHADSLNEAIRQLTLFICNTGFSDMVWRNAPVVNKSLDTDGNRKIALVDLEDFGSVDTGIFGAYWPYRRGLIKCVTENQAKIVVKEAKKHLHWNLNVFEQRNNQAAQALQERKEELIDGDKLKQFYSTHNIQKGDEKIDVNPIDLDFSTFSKSEELKLLAKRLIDEINKRTAESSPQKSVKGRRYIYINTNDENLPFVGKQTLIDNKKSPNEYASDEAFYNATYLGAVVKKLVDLGHLYKLIERNGHGYYIQA